MSASKDKGTAFETLVVRYLQANGFPEAHRNALAGAKDVGDVGGLPFVLELKNCVRLDLAGWTEEAAQEAINRDIMPFFFAVIHKRRGMGQAADQYVTLPLWIFVRLLVAWTTLNSDRSYSSFVSGDE